MAALLLTTGCGNQYRPVVSAISPVGPAGQPTKYAVAVSNPTPGGTGPGLVTFVDFSGDTVLSTPSILSNPSYFQINASGNEAVVVNAAGTFQSFNLSSPTNLITTGIPFAALSASAVPVSLALYGSTIYVPESGLQQVAELGFGTSSLLQSVSTSAPPVYVVGTDNAQREYAISQSATGGNGEVSALENSTLSVSAIIPVGVTPIYGVMTPDGNRAFILNKGSGTVSVINVPSNAPDAAVPTITLPTIAYTGGTTSPKPVWADFVSINSEMVVLNQGDSVHPGSLSIISIPLCNSNTPVVNPNCDASNPVDAAGFGTIVATVPVGINPSMVSVLVDGSRAYVANQGSIANGVQGSVSVVNLISGTLETTLAAVSSATAVDSTPTAVFGHPNTIAATTGTPTGKVYVSSSDNTQLTVIRTDEDIVDTHISMQGYGMPPPAAGSNLPQSPGVVVTVK